MTLSRRGFLRAAAMAPALPLAVARMPAPPTPPILVVRGVMTNVVGRFSRVVMTSHSVLTRARITLPWTNRPNIEFPRGVTHVMITDSHFIMDRPPWWARLWGALS